jgi:methyl-accepting chemotaxis protein
VSENVQIGVTSRRLLSVMVASGLAIGLAFPLMAGLFVESKDATSSIIFWFMCVLAGVGLGLFCYTVAMRTSEKLMLGVLMAAKDRLGLDLNDTSGLEEQRTELFRLFGEVTSMLRQSGTINNDIRALTSEVLTATEEQASGAAEQAAAVTETSATVEELAQTSKQIADNSSSVVAVAERTLASAEEGMQSVADTSDGIEEIRQSTQASSDRILALGERSQEIGRVLVIIDDIAEQTKILALNAAIEAARAGEAGKGFAVVAEEIRKLADSVTESTQEIGRVVREIQASTSSLIMATERAAKKVDEGKLLAGRTADSLDKIVSQVEETTDSAKQISIATQQQRTASDQVVISMREVAQVSQQAAETSRQISAVITELNQLADNIITR